MSLSAQGIDPKKCYTVFKQNNVATEQILKKKWEVLNPWHLRLGSTFHIRILITLEIGLLKNTALLSV